VLKISLRGPKPVCRTARQLLVRRSHQLKRRAELEYCAEEFSSGSNRFSASHMAPILQG
jgi:hypothetical protein